MGKFLKNVRKLFLIWKSKCWGVGTMITSPTSCHKCRHFSKKVYSKSLVCRCKLYNIPIMRPLKNCCFYDKKEK